MNTCHLGCGNPALFFHAKTGVGRCAKNNASCPVIIERKAVKRAAIVKPEITPEPCECGKPGLAYSPRSKRWRCDIIQGNCSALVTKRDKTMLERYGTITTAHIEGIQERRSNTLSENHALRSNDEKAKIQERRTSTMVERYGVENIGQHAETRQKISENNQIKYGVDHTLQVPEFRTEGKKTMLERYGAEHPAHVKSIVDQKKQTMIERYGVEYPYQSEVIREKFKETMLERWGSEIPMHIPEIVEKQQAALYLKKEYFLPSGRRLLLQGYEPFAINHLLKHGFEENDLGYDFKEKPVISYVFDEKNKKYYPDLFWFLQKHIIEIKSHWTLYGRENQNYARNKRKQQASLDAGFKFTFMVFTDNAIFDKFEGDEISPKLLDNTKLPRQI